MRISDWSSDVCSSDLIAITGQQDQPFGLLVEAADRKDALLMADEIDDVALDLGVGGAGNASGLVQGDIDMAPATGNPRSEEHTSELQSLMRNAYAVFCLQKKRSWTSTRTTLRTYRTTFTPDPSSPKKELQPYIIPSISIPSMSTRTVSP